MRNESHKKKHIGQVKEWGGGEEERKNIPSPSIFVPLKPKIPFHDLGLSSFWNHMEMLATQATTTAMNLPTAFDSEFLLIMDSQDDL